SLIKIGSHFAHRVPKCGRGRFQEARSPSCHCELAARTNRMPKRTNGCCHIRDEKNSKDADYGVEPWIAKVHIEQVVDPKLSIRHTALCGLRSCKFKQVCREVDAQNGPSWPDYLGGRQSRRSTSAAHIKHT